MNRQKQEQAVRLRAMEPEDLDLLYRIENDEQLWSVGTTNVPYSRYVLHDYIANSSGDIYTDRQVRLIIENDKGCPLGIVDLINFSPQHRRAEVGVVVAREYRCQGIAAAALVQLEDYSRRILHLHQLYAIINDDNIPALQLFRKMHYNTTSMLKEWLYDGQQYHNAVLMQTFL